MADQGEFVPTRTRDKGNAVEGGGWLLFASIMVMIAGVLNIIWGIAAISNSKFFTQNTTYILSDLNTWGWIVLIIGALELFAAYSILVGGQYGRWLGILMASINSIAALMSIPAYPFWSLCLFAIDILIIYGLAAYGGQRKDVV
ncbi:MAG: hypothetical protein WB998_04980 [Solirubrobacteraceae bacterium]